MSGEEFLDLIKRIRFELDELQTVLMRINHSWNG